MARHIRKYRKKIPVRLIKMCRKYKIKCTKKVGKRRVYKSITVLKKQLRRKLKSKKVRKTRRVRKTRKVRKTRRVYRTRFGNHIYPSFFQENNTGELNPLVTRMNESERNKKLTNSLVHKMNQSESKIQQQLNYQRKIAAERLQKSLEARKAAAQKAETAAAIKIQGAVKDFQARQKLEKLKKEKEAAAEAQKAREALETEQKRLSELKKQLDEQNNLKNTIRNTNGTRLSNAILQLKTNEQNIKKTVKTVKEGSNAIQKTVNKVLSRPASAPAPPRKAFAPPPPPKPLPKRPASAPAKRAAPPPKRPSPYAPLPPKKPPKKLRRFGRIRFGEDEGDLPVLRGRTANNRMSMEEMKEDMRRILEQARKADKEYNRNVVFGRRRRFGLRRY